MFVDEDRGCLFLQNEAYLHLSPHSNTTHKNNIFTAIRTSNLRVTGVYFGFSPAMTVN
jgi:hypothetical protein